MVLTATLTQSGVLTNTALIAAADQPDPDDTNNSARAAVTSIGPRADLEIVKVVNNEDPKGTAYAVGLSMIFAVAGTIEGSFLRKTTRKTFHLINVLGFAVYAIWMIDHSAFIYIVYHYVAAMISVALIQIWAYLHHRAATAPWIIAGVITTLIAAVIQQSGFRLHDHFNNNDLYHVVQIVGLLLLYRGASQLESTAL